MTNMSWRSLKWNHCHPVIGDAEVVAVENALGVRFPSDFRACIQECHGGSPSNRSFRVPAAGIQFGSCLAVLLSFSCDDPENILKTCGCLMDQLPNGLIPFATDGGGDYMCFDFNALNAEGTPTVVYWHRAGLAENEFTKLSKDFSGFLESLNADKN